MPNARVLLLGVAGALGLLALFLLLQEFHASVLALPSQWLWVSSIPVLLGIIAGGYIGKVKAGDIFEGEFKPSIQNLPVAPTSVSTTAPS
jgi:hypothetical protein